MGKWSFQEKMKEKKPLTFEKKTWDFPRDFFFYKNRSSSHLLLLFAFTVFENKKIEFLAFYHF